MACSRLNTAGSHSKDYVMKVVNVVVVSCKSLIAVMMDNEVNYHKSMCVFISISKTSWAERDCAHASRRHVLTNEQYEVSEHL